MFPTDVLYNSALEIIILTVTVVAAAVIATLVYLNNRQSATNRIFALLSLCTVLWLVITYVVRMPLFLPHALLLHRLGIFFAAPMSLALFLLGHTMPGESVRLSQRLFWGSIGATVMMMLLNISPYAFTGAVLSDGMSRPEVGFGLMPFAVGSTLFSVLAVYFLARSYRRSVATEKRQIGLMLAGIFLMLTLIILTILMPVVVFNSLVFLPFTPLYVLVFLGLTAYAITKYHLFNIKVLLTQALIVVIDIVLFAKLFGETSVNARVVDLLVLICMLVFGFFLVRSVRREVAQRELIEKQEKELEATNTQLRELDKQKSEFLSFASHQLRTPLTAIKLSAGAIIDGTYGAVPDYLQSRITAMFEQSRSMAVLISDYLNVSRIEQGKMEYKFEAVNLGDALKTVDAEMRLGVQERGLTLAVDVGSERVIVWGDSGKLVQVFGNIIDNAMKYTPKGGITVTLKKVPERNVARIEVRDTGIGMNAETLGRVFEKFSRGDNARVVNTGGSGLGLFIVKTFVEAHKGKIWPESDGVGKGTNFFIELPLFVEHSANTL